MNRRAVIVFIAFVVVFVCAAAYSQSLEEIKAQARAEVRREMGLDRPVPRRTVTGEDTARRTADMPAKRPRPVAGTLAAILAGISILPASIARMKGRSFIAWWFLSMLCFPVVLPVSILMKRSSGARRSSRVPRAAPAEEAAYSQKNNSVSNRAFIRGFFDEVFINRDLDAADELVAEGFVGHDMPEGLPFGREGFKKYFKDIYRSFPDLEYKIEDVVAGDDKAVVRWTGKGTHGGEFRGIAPTGKPVTIKGVSIYRIKGGKVAELWGETDAAGLIEQLKG